MFQEVEIKFRPTDQQVSLLEEFLYKEARFVGQLHHEEYYLDRSDKSFLFTSEQGYQDAYQYLRVRLVDTGDSVCFKYWHVDEEASQKSGHLVHSHCDEYETTVEDGRVLLELFKAL